MSVDGYLEDEATQHQIYLLLLAQGQLQDVAVFIEKAIKVAERRVADGLSAYGTRRYEVQIQALQQELTTVYSVMKEQLQLDLGKMAVVESQYNIKLLEQVVRPVVRLSTPSAQIISAAATSSPLQLESRAGIQRISISGALDDFGTKKSAQIIGEIQIGSALGETTPQISRRLSSLHQLQRDQATAIVRTMTNHVATTARVETLKENDDILIGMRRVATLDSRTSLFCMGVDQTVIPLDGPRPPYHWNCRTTLIPVLKPEYSREIPGSTRPSVGPDGAKPVSSKSSYGEWLARQPAAFQKEVLGPARYKLFSKGKLPLHRFVDTNGKTLTLEQLKQKEPAAYKRAEL